MKILLDMDSKDRLILSSTGAPTQELFFTYYKQYATQPLEGCNLLLFESFLNHPKVLLRHPNVYINTMASCLIANWTAAMPLEDIENVLNEPGFDFYMVINEIFGKIGTEFDIDVVMVNPSFLDPLVNGYVRKQLIDEFLEENP